MDSPILSPNFVQKTYKPRQLTKSISPIRLPQSYYDDIIFWKYFQGMPELWVYCILGDSDFPVESEEDFITLDKYLKGLGFTGRPTYACMSCNMIYDCDMTWKWNVISKRDIACPCCQRKLIPYKETPTS